jgi:hypothetical protein
VSRLFALIAAMDFDMAIAAPGNLRFPVKLLILRAGRVPSPEPPSPPRAARLGGCHLD